MSRSITYLIFISLLALVLNVPVEKSKQPVKPAEPTKKEQVNKALKKVKVLIFTASWCPACQDARMKNLPEKLQKKNISVQVIDVDKNPKLAQKYEVEYLPTTVVIKNGEVVQKKTGIVTAATILRIVAAALIQVIPWLLDFWGL